MASNDPGWGGNGGKNNGGKKDGPPDLDEMLRDVTRKINKLFGRGGKGGNGAPQPVEPARPAGFGGAGLVLALILVIWVGTGFYIVDQGNRGVVLRFGKHVETTLPGPRWHIPWPIETVDTVNMQHSRNVQVGYRGNPDEGNAPTRQLHESLMLTDDENIIDLQFAVQYDLKSAEDALFNNRSSESATGEEDSVRSIAETAIREIVGKSSMDYVLYEGRTEVAQKVKVLMQEILDRYQTGIHVVSVSMQNAQPPEQVQAAFDDAVKAGQDLDRQKNEGQAYANDVIPKARGTAARLLEEANGYKQRVIDEAQGNASRFTQVLAQYQKAPEVTRTRMYLDAQEQVLSNSSKVLIDQKSGTGNMLYLPLDKLMGQSSSPSSTAQVVPSVVQPINPAQPSQDDSMARSRDASRSRDREDRP
jgi:membrane protease subunit HflK